MDGSLDQKAILSVSELEKVLAATKGNYAKMLSWKNDHFTQNGDNFQSLVNAIKVLYSLNGETLSTSYVVKHSPDPHNMLEGFSTPLFEKEVHFYTELASLLSSELEAVGESPLKIPNCFFASSEHGHERIVLEDLRLKGFKMTDRRVPLDVPRVNMALKELARLHAAGFLLERKTPLENLEDKYEFLKVDIFNNKENAEQFQYNLWFTAMETVADNLANVSGYEAVQEWLTKNKRRGSEIVFSHLKTTNLIKTFCHGDCWVNNMLYRYDDKGDPVEVTFVDLQMCRMSSPATDLQFFLSTCLDGRTRKDGLGDFLSIYYESFVSVLKMGGVDIPYTLEELKQEFKEKLSYGLLTGMFILKMTLSETAHYADDTETKSDFIGNLKKKGMEMEGGNDAMKSRILGLIDNVINEGFSFE